MDRLRFRALTNSKYLRRVVALASMLVLSACISADGPANYLYPEGPRAIQSDRLWDITFAIAAVIFFVVEGALIFIILRYRANKANAQPKQLHGHTRLELLWTAIPALILTGIAFMTVPVIFDQAREPEGALKVQVIGHQWWWEYKYDNGVVTANELHVPINRPVLLELRSADVIHSYWIPKLAGKQDLVPGRINHLTIEATEPGEYYGQCAEYCGLSHANMRARVFAHEPADYERWVAEQRAPAAADNAAVAEGRELFLNGRFAGGQQCVSCHAVGGTAAAGVIGPNLTHFASRTGFAGEMFEMNEENLKAWLRDPPARKPGSKMPDLNLTEEQINDLSAYLLSLE
ncbi:MAG TPA: cytochrome c oxidase subunit II [Actinomycetota bacterium]|nr:cytochrome c oxidase subunit II [Actinomycetota bacterium]